MAEFSEVTATEREADETMEVALTSAANAGDIGQSAVALVHALNAIRFEIRAQGMRLDSVIPRLR